jgi:peptidoglycan hydrolase-like protein with peptidoglycan-binding domain
MYKPFLCVLIPLALVSAGFGTPKSSRFSKNSVSTVSAKKADAPANSASRSSRQKRGRASRQGGSRQQQPTADRYREIQQALADRGYLKSEPNGIWGPESVEALKKFQEDQNLKPSGKLDPLSLISLGLGPKRVTASTEPPAEQPKTEQP